MSSTVSGTGAHGALVVDPSPDVVLQSAFEYAPETVLRVKRSLNTADNADVAIVVSCKAIFFFHNFILLLVLQKLDQILF